MTNWNKKALKARLRADIAFDTAIRPVTADVATRRLEYFNIVTGVDAGTITPEAGAVLFDELAETLAA
ncbi:hypothetical protein [Herbiconiux ginsengi]|uniref:Uncharacterized protein n=1 Tax=Herbiconiux ginsengi TaxID=381665 RepID=A0A1H3TMF0_9MICO|nr:hypothetical protein [Herbiconiux ginsengi]SDZ51290.1 hypothetical protein SAMN05216554_4349 [Herbiconiux ginsengi]